MSSTTAPLTTTTDQDRARRALVPVGVATFLVILFFAAFRSNNLGEAVTVVALDLVALALVMGLVVAPGLRREGTGIAGIVLGVLGVAIVVPAFWTGLPMVFGAGAMLLGYAGRRAPEGSGKAIAALVLGALGVVGFFAVFVADWIAEPGAAWWA